MFTSVTLQIAQVLNQAKHLIHWHKWFDIHQIWYALLGTFFGASAALYLANCQNKKRKFLAKTALAERLQFNFERATQMLGQFGSGISPNYLFDTTGIVIWLTVTADILDNNLIAAINWHRYQLDHLNAKLSVYYISISQPSLSSEAKLVEQKQSICQHLDEVIGGTCDLKTRLLAQ